MKILSVNVSPVRELADGERRVPSGILKVPVDGAVRVGRLNLDGDAQADRVNHGGEHKAVYAFGAQHFARWREALGRENVGAGFFGENLTVDVLDEHALGIGDRLRAGTVLLEITQPRVPCFKLGLRAGDATLPRAFLARGLTGAYLRVIEEGELAAGDAIERVPRGGRTRPLAELFAAVHDRSHPARREILAAALGNPALSEEWYGEIVERLRRLDARDSP